MKRRMEIRTELENLAILKPYDYFKELRDKVERKIEKRVSLDIRMAVEDVKNRVSERVWLRVWLVGKGHYR